jgi:hypothetical protein
MKIGYCDSCPVVTGVDAVTGKARPEVHLDPRNKVEHVTKVLEFDAESEPRAATEPQWAFFRRMIEKYAKK